MFPSIRALSLVFQGATLACIIGRYAETKCVLLVTFPSIYVELVQEGGNHMYITTERVWETFHVPLQQFIRRRVSDDATAEDLLQDVFLKIHQHVETLRDVKKLESWIYKLTRNAIIDYYRSIRPTTSLDVPEALQLPEELPDEDVISELFPSVRAMVTSLPAQDRQALILTEYQGLTQKELAERLGLSVSGAKSRVREHERNSSNSF